MLEIHLDALVGVIAVHEGEVDVAPLGCESRQRLWQKRVAVTFVPHHVVEARAVQPELQIEAVHFAAVRSDPA